MSNVKVVLEFLLWWCPIHKAIDIVKTTFAFHGKKLHITNFCWVSIFYKSKNIPHIISSNKCKQEKKKDFELEYKMIHKEII